MTIFEARGFSNLLYPSKKSEELGVFEYIATFPIIQVPDGVDLEEWKRTKAPYCISGKVKAEKNGSYKRNNDSLVYRDLIFLDYDDLEAGTDLPELARKALFGYSYIIYPTIKHTPENPRYRLVVKPSHNMDEISYKKAVGEIAGKIGLPYDPASLVWSQLQGLPVVRGHPEDFPRIIERGLDYPVTPAGNGSRATGQEFRTDYRPRAGRRSPTMRVLDTLSNGYGGEGGRNIALTRFVGLLLSQAVDASLEEAYELAKIANNVTDDPLPLKELDRTFESVAKKEYRKRGGQYR